MASKHSRVPTSFLGKQNNGQYTTTGAECSPGYTHITGGAGTQPSEAGCDIDPNMQDPEKALAKTTRQACDS